MKMIDTQDPAYPQFVSLDAASRMRTRLQALAHVLETSRLTMLREDERDRKTFVEPAPVRASTIEKVQREDGKKLRGFGAAGQRAWPKNEGVALSAGQINALAHELGLSPQSFRQMIAATH